MEKLRSWDERSLLSTIFLYPVASSSLLSKLTEGEFLSGCDYRFPGLTEKQTNILQIGWEIDRMRPRKKILYLSKLLYFTENMEGIAYWCVECARLGNYRKRWLRCARLAAEIRDGAMNKYLREIDDYRVRSGINFAVDQFNKLDLRPICL